MRVCVCVFIYLDVSLMWDVLQDDGLHGEDVGKLHLRDVECAHNMGPTWQGDGSMPNYGLLWMKSNLSIPVEARNEPLLL